MLGLVALVFAAILLCLAALNEYRVRAPLLEAGEAAARNYAFTDAGLRNSHVIEGMGMIGGMLDRWSRDRNRALAAQAIASDRGAAISSTIRFFRLLMQSLMLGAAAYLVIDRIVTPGIMFASVILLARAPHEPGHR